jgi:hypothetical protein
LIAQMTCISVYWLWATANFGVFSAVSISVMVLVDVTRCILV